SLDRAGCRSLGECFVGWFLFDLRWILLTRRDDRSARVRQTEEKKVVVDERQQSLAGGMSLLQIGQEVRLTLLPGLLDQHLGVSDDLIKWREQVVDQTRWQRVPGCFGWAWRLRHDAGVSAEAILPSPRLNSASILPSRRGSSMGLVS